MANNQNNDSRAMLSPNRDAAIDVSAADHTFTTIPTTLFIGNGGDLVVRLVGSSTDTTYENLPDGSELVRQVSIVRTSGTTATGIIAAWYEQQ